MVYIFGLHASNYLSTYKSFDISRGQNKKDVGQTLKTMSHFWHQILATVNFHIFKKTKILKTHLIYRWKHVDSLNAKHKEIKLLTMIAIDGVVSKMEIRIWMIYLKQDFISSSYHMNGNFALSP